MITLKRRTIETGVACLVAAVPVVLLLWVYPTQIPESAAEDINSLIYPNTLTITWLALSVVAIAEAWSRSKDEQVTIGGDNLRYPATICLIVLLGFALLLMVGFLVGAAFYVLAFSWLLKERGLAAWLAALFVPFAIYAILLYAFEVRLPSVLDLLID